ncbi:MAG: hypothetical protein GY737_16460 [Desulfobacteraceae bacterium]|nr:hypothetical protein [Desulfobacteraceae bacterium]
MIKRVIPVLGFYIVNQDEIGVMLTLGKYSGKANPGLGFAIPIFQQVIKTPSSLQTIDLPDQQVVLSGNISVTISGNLNFRVADPQKAILGVSNYSRSIQQLALTTISDVLGTKTLEEVRTKKSMIADEIESVINESAVRWGLNDIDIRLTDASIDETLLRAMMRETEAKKEASAVKIKAESDKMTAEMFAEAADILSASPGAMTLRILQTLNDISSDKSTIVVPIPMDLLSGKQLDKFADPPVQDQKQAPALSDIAIRENKLYCFCPECSQQYDVTDIAGADRYDKLPNVPGQQIGCKKCGALFTLPTVRKQTNLE